MAHDTSVRAANPSPDDVGAWRLAVHLPSERGASRIVTEGLLEQLGIHGWESADVFSIHLAAEEAIVNAIVHGNKLDPHKQVYVECRQLAAEWGWDTERSPTSDGSIHRQGGIP